MIFEDYLEKLEPSERLPSEAELCVKYSVSRPTVTKALRDFVDQGLIRKEKGRGTFLVRKPYGATVNAGVVPGIPTIVLIMAYVAPEGVFGDIARSLERQSIDRPFQLILTNLIHDIDSVASHLRLLLDRGPSGALFLPELGADAAEEKNAKTIALLQELAMPFVVVDHLPLTGAGIGSGEQAVFAAEIPYDFVVPDHETGGYMATKLLLEAGHARIGYLGDAGSGAEALRERGFRRAMRQAGVKKPPILRRVGLIYATQFSALVQQFMRKHNLTAIFADNDIVARSVIVELGRKGMRPPADYSIIGHDGLDLSGLIVTELSTVVRDIHREAAVAVELVMRRIADRTAAVRQVILPVTVRAGGTVGPPVTRT